MRLVFCPDKLRAANGNKISVEWSEAYRRTKGNHNNEQGRLLGLT